MGGGLVLRISDLHRVVDYSGYLHRRDHHTRGVVVDGSRCACIVCRVECRLHPSLGGRFCAAGCSSYRCLKRLLPFVLCEPLIIAFLLCRRAGATKSWSQWILYRCVHVHISLRSGRDETSSDGVRNFGENRAGRDAIP